MVQASGHLTRQVEFAKQKEPPGAPDSQKLSNTERVSRDPRASVCVVNHWCMFGCTKLWVAMPGAKLEGKIPGAGGSWI